MEQIENLFYGNDVFILVLFKEKNGNVFLV